MSEPVSRGRAGVRAVRLEEAIRAAEALAGRRKLRGVGCGVGEDYRSALHVREFSSLGRSGRKPVFGKQRLHTTFSDIETDLLLNLSWDGDVVDVREQFLLDLRTTVSIADELGVNHPRSRGKLKVMTLDLLVARSSVSAEHAISVKPLRKLGLRRVKEVLEIERRYARQAKWTFQVMTECDVPPVLTANLRVINPFWEFKPLPGRPADDIPQIAAALARVIADGPELPLAEACRRVASERGLVTGFCLNVVWHQLATKAWITSLAKPLDTGKPLRLETGCENTPGA